MASTTGTHTLTYPDSGSTNWAAAFDAFAQAITDHLDEPTSMQFATLESIAGTKVVEISDSFSGSWLDIDSGNGSNSVKLTASGTATDLELVPGASKSVVLDGIKWPQADGSASHILYTDGAGQLSFGIMDITLDTAPILGANLNVASYYITGTSHVDVQLADDIGTNKFRVKDNNGIVVAHIDSDGDIDFVDATCTSITATTGIFTNATITNPTFPDGSIDVADLDITSFSTATTWDLDVDYFLHYDGSSSVYRKILGKYLTSSNGLVAWAHIVDPGGTPTITGTGFTSVTDNGVGDYTLNWGSGTVNDTNFVAVSQAGHASTNYINTWEDTDLRSTTGVNIKVGTTVAVDPGVLDIMIMENYA